MFVDSKQNLHSPSFILLLPLLTSHSPNPASAPPPPHPAHHCLVNLLKTPICLSDLNGSFKWLGFPQTPLKAPLLSTPQTQAALLLLCFISGLRDISHVTCSPQGLCWGSAPFQERPPFFHSATANLNQNHSGDQGKKKKGQFPLDSCCFY